MSRQLRQSNGNGVGADPRLRFSAPHWQVIDSHGHAYLLQRLVIKGDKFNKSIMVPDYVHDVARVQIWCAWAEVNLGEAAFEKPLRLTKN